MHDLMKFHKWNNRDRKFHKKFMVIYWDWSSNIAFILSHQPPLISAVSTTNILSIDVQKKKKKKQVETATKAQLPPSINIAYEFVWIPLIVENWKYCNKIIFKCVNSTVGFNFKEKFAEIRTCRSREQCMGPTQKRLAQAQTQTQTHLNPNSHYIIKILLGIYNFSELCLLPSWPNCGGA